MTLLFSYRYERNRPTGSINGKLCVLSTIEEVKEGCLPRSGSIARSLEGDFSVLLLNRTTVTIPQARQVGGGRPFDERLGTKNVRRTLLTIEGGLTGHFHLQFAKRNRAGANSSGKQGY